MVVGNMVDTTDALFKVFWSPWQILMTVIPAPVKTVEPAWMHRIILPVFAQASMVGSSVKVW